MFKIMKTTILVLLFFSSLVYGRTMTIEVTGVVTSVESGGGLSWDSSVAEGALMTGSCSYDLDAISANGYSYPLLSMTMTIGNYNFITDLALFRTGKDKVYAATTWDGVFDGGVLDDGEIKTFDEIVWSSTYFELFNIYSTLPECPYSNDLPESIDLSLFNERQEFTACFSEAIDSYICFDGELTSLTVIPEPCSVLLLGFGVIGVLSRRR